MRIARVSGSLSLLLLLIGLLLLPAPAAEADGGSGDSADRLVGKALDALRLRIEARMKEGELLGKSGRVDEALSAYRSVGGLYERGMADIREMMAGLPAARTAVGPDKPFASPALEPRAPDARSAAEAIDRALNWLAAHQTPTGAWQAADFDVWCKGKPIVDGRFGPDGKGKPAYDVGVTGLALLAFVENGHAHRGNQPHAKTVKQGLDYLLRVQDAEGCIGARASQHYIYNHVVAALALVETYALTRSPLVRPAAQKAIEFISMARNPYMAWRYGVRPGDNDTSVTSWCVKCLRAAESVNERDRQADRPETFKVDKAGFEGALAWVDKMTDPQLGRVGYNQRGGLPARPQEMIQRFPAKRSEALTAAGVLTRILCGQDPESHPLIKKGAALCSQLPPVWNPTDGSIDMYYWFHGTLAMQRVGGEAWETWSTALDRAVVATQRRDGDVCSFLGSWDPIGPWGPDGGRVYATALMALTLTPKAADERRAKPFGSRPRRK